MRLAVTAPATVANLGSGFDCLALALDLENEVRLEADVPPTVEVEGEGRDELPTDVTNLVFRTITYLAREAGGRLPPIALKCRNRIPLQRGLGSSAAAVVAGLLLADRLLGTALSPDRLLETAVDLEGHADNVAACLRGGMVLAYLSDDGWRAEAVRPNPSLRPVVLIPAAERVATDEARRVLPRTVPLGDASFALARSALAVLAFTERPHLLAAALEDRLHQNRRFPLMPAAAALYRDLREAGLPACVAGSGPSLLAFETADHRLWDLGPGWLVIRPRIGMSGATVREEQGEETDRTGR
jgi:homoserine kinase